MKRSILFKLLMINTLVILGVVVVSTITNSIRSSQVITEEIEEQLLIELSFVTQAIEEKKETTIKEILIMSNTEVIQNYNKFPQDALEALKELYSANVDSIEGYFILDSTGRVAIDSNDEMIGADYASWTYYKDAMAGDCVWSDVIVYDEAGNATQVMAVPIESKGKVIGVLGATVDFKIFQEIVNEVKIGENGYGYMIDKDGIIISHPDAAMVGTNIRDLEIAELNNAIDSMTNGESHEFYYSYMGIAKLDLYGPVGDWSLSITADKNEYLSPVKKLRREQEMLGAIFFIFGTVLIVIFSSRMVRRIKVINGIMKEVARGDLTVRVQKAIQNGDEVDQMGFALNQTIDELHSIVDSIKLSSELLATSAQQLSAASEESQASTEETAAKMEKVVGNIRLQTKEIDAASRRYTTLHGNIVKTEEISKLMAQSTDKVIDMSSEGSEIVLDARHQMENIKETSEKMVLSIEKLLQQSHEIGSINEMISQIADQTNLLALNAAIEAARAGEQGRGFAVVAEEIRKLAAQSQSSAMGIQSLIHELQEEITSTSEYITEESTKVNIGLEAVRNSEKALSQIGAKIHQVKEMISDVDGFANGALQDAESVNSAMGKVVEQASENAESAESVNAVSEEQTAVAEEIAAASCKLTSMAEALVNSVNHFTV